MVYQFRGKILNNNDYPKWVDKKNNNMNLQEVAQKYRISDNFLNSKDDGLLVASKSIQDLINEINQDAKRGIDENRKQSIITKMEMLRDFLKDVKNSGV